MERYTFVDKDGLYIEGANGKVWSDKRGRVYGKAIGRLAAYEDTGLEPEEIMADMPDIAAIEAELDRYKCAEAEGRLVLLPCEVGDTVYYLTGNPILANGYHFSRVENTKCVGFYFAEKGLKIAMYMPHGNHGTYGYFGKPVFITREEAEAILKQDVK